MLMCVCVKWKGGQRPLDVSKLMGILAHIISRVNHRARERELVCEATRTAFHQRYNVERDQKVEKSIVGGRKWMGG